MFRLRNCLLPISTENITIKYDLGHEYEWRDFFCIYFFGICICRQFLNKRKYE